MDKLNYAIESFKNIQDLIKFADQKAGAILIVTGLIFTGYVQYLEDLVLSDKNVNLLGTLTFLASCVTLVSMTIVIYYTIFKILRPKIRKELPARRIVNILF